MWASEKCTNIKQTKERKHTATNKMTDNLVDVTLISV